MAGLFHSRVKIALLALLLGGCGQVHEATLKNGLRVVVMEDQRAPTVVSQVWYKVGSQDEPEGLTGVAHVLEHMMFKGTQRLKPNEFSRIIAEHGGRENAFTGSDYTAYFQQLEKSRLPISFELEADRMLNLALKEEEFRKEIRVVMEERRLRTEDQPEALLAEKFMATAYQVHPYKHPIIGWMRDLEKMTVADVRAWYRRWYAPNNATVVVVGDVKAAEVFDLAEKYFGPIPARPIERVVAPAEPRQEQARRVRVAAPAEVPHLVLGYHAPVLTRADDWEPYALSVLAGVLDGGQSARFARELVRGQKIAAGVDTDYSSIGRSPTLITFDGTPAQGRTIEELERAIRAQVERVKNEPVGADELRRVKAQVAAADVYGRDSVFYQAMRLGMLETVGLDRRLLDEYVERINAVTAEQVREVARKYLVDTNLTTAVLDPLPINKRGGHAPAAVTHGR
ncbi:MAG: peptidase M16 [Candidatus Muproteobacteria bacterium RBG_16_65_31]|uniref:Peptidase M16 n=1 Tax=Candidatus Muproteobacteria bacterium RBG_16_65_31 TaxID=1817759 RepID=A0A1F6TFJ1_9PROT|nr:MAG: peptidase M16 [Candidatus Muproteobacteria bacterium RBG_16_65_31]